VLEGCRGKEAFGVESCLGDAEDYRFALSRLVACLDGLLVRLLKVDAVHQLTGQISGIASLDHDHAAEHLAHHHFDVLVVDVHTLRAVHLLDLEHQIVAHRLDAHDFQDLVRVLDALGDLLASNDLIARAHTQAGRGRDLILALARLLYDNHDAAAVHQGATGGTCGEGLALLARRRDSHSLASLHVVSIHHDHFIALGHRV